MYLKQQFLEEDHPPLSKAQARHLMGKLNEEDHQLVKPNKIGIGHEL